MSGTYNGGDFTLGKDASFADFAAIQARQDAQAAVNIAAWMGVSQADLAQMAAASDRPSRVSAAAIGAAAVPTSGPGVPSVGVAPTGGPGVPAVGGSPRRGAGVLGTLSTSGFAGSGAGVPGVMNFGGVVLPPSKTLDGVTSYTLFGHKVRVNPGVSDANTFEQRVGDSELLTTMYGVGVVAADLYNELDVTLGSPRASVDVGKVLRDANDWLDHLGPFPVTTAGTPIYEADPMRSRYPGN